MFQPSQVRHRFLARQTVGRTSLWSSGRDVVPRTQRTVSMKSLPRQAGNGWTGYDRNQIQPLWSDVFLSFNRNVSWKCFWAMMINHGQRFCLCLPESKVSHLALVSHCMALRPPSNQNKYTDPQWPTHIPYFNACLLPRCFLHLCDQSKFSFRKVAHFSSSSSHILLSILHP